MRAVWRLERSSETSLMAITSETWPRVVWAFMRSGVAQNDARYSNALVDEMLDKARQTADPAERKALYTKIWRQVREDMPLLYLWTQANIVGMSAKLTGFRPVPDGLIRLQGVSMAK